MSNLQETVLAFLANAGWEPERHPERAAYAVQIAGDHGQFRLYIEILEDRNQIVCYAVLPTLCPEDRRLRLAEVLGRINFGLIVGCFEMDWSDGEIRFRTALDADNLQLTPEACKGLVFPCVLALDRYIPALMAGMFGSETPQAIVATAEGESRTS